MKTHDSVLCGPRSQHTTLWIYQDTIVCRAAQEADAPYRGYIDRKKENVIFTFLYLGDPLFHWNQSCCRVACQLGKFTF